MSFPELQWEYLPRPPWWRRPFLRGLDRLPAVRLTPESKARLDVYVDARLDEVLVRCGYRDHP